MVENVALAASGGGFRAAAFALGALSYLNQLDVGKGSFLKRVKFFGSTSGGSFANLAYTTGICDGDDFQQIYKRLSKAMEGETLIANAFEILDDDQSWNDQPEKSRNLINAFSLAYNQHLFNGKDFNFLNTNLSKTHLDQVCVNSTELANGQSFRFQSQNSENKAGNGKVGNRYVFFLAESRQVFGKLRLADILASSSCFPGGFEPLIFPEDFTHHGLPASQLSEGIVFSDNPFSTNRNPEDLFKDEQFNTNPKRFGLLDGGIADNQAIDCILLANDRRVAKKMPPFDLILVCDVTSYLLDGYTLPVEKPSFLSRFSLRFWRNLLIGLSIGFLVLLVLLSLFGWNPYLTLLLLPLAASAGLLFYLRDKVSKAKGEVHAGKSTWGIIFFRYFKHFFKRRMSLLSQMVTARLKSVFLITSDIYLKQIRAHYYEQLFSNEKFRDITVVSAIYDLSEVNFSKAKSSAHEPSSKTDSSSGLTHQVLVAESELVADEITEEHGVLVKLVELPKIPRLVPTDAVRDAAEQARLVATTLWFDENSVANADQKAIIATGQFTVCHNLINYFHNTARLRAKARNLPVKSFEQMVRDNLDAEERAHLKKLRDDWRDFGQDPYWLIKILDR